MRRRGRAADDGLWLFIACGDRPGECFTACYRIKPCAGSMCSQSLLGLRVRSTGTQRHRSGTICCRAEFVQFTCVPPPRAPIFSFLFLTIFLVTFLLCAARGGGWTRRLGVWDGLGPLRRRVWPAWCVRLCLGTRSTRPAQTRNPRAGHRRRPSRADQPAALRRPSRGPHPDQGTRRQPPPHTRSDMRTRRGAVCGCS